MVHNPEIVILDEPFSGLDPVNAMILEDVVKREIEAGKIVLFSSHQMNYVEEFCDNIAILNQGEIVLSGNIRDIKRSYKRDRLRIRSTEQEKILNDYNDRVRLMDDGAMLFQMDSEADKQRVMQELATKYEIDSMRVYEPTLNDIFVEYTGGDKELGGEEVDVA